MKKLLNISVIAALAILPVAANAAAGDIAPSTYAIAAGDAGTTTATDTEPVAGGAPLYTGKTVTTEDAGHVATAAYVKGAYNAALSAVNKVSQTAAADATTKADAAKEAAKGYTDTQLAGYTTTTDLQTNYATKDGVEYTVNAATATGNVTATLQDITPAGSVSSNFTNGEFSGSVTLPDSVDVVTAWGNETTTPLALNPSATPTAISGTVTGDVSSSFTGTTITGATATAQNVSLDVEVDDYHATAPENNG